VNAGHQPGLLLRAGRGEAELCRGGPALGLVDEPAYDTGEQRVASGDVLVVFSDGLPERASPSGDLFGRERIRTCLAETRRDPARIALYSLLGDVQGWSEGGPADDDQTVIVARLR
jgi:sigma-B regulation protein RsbU (phosphoserine phosphatase)